MVPPIQKRRAALARDQSWLPRATQKHKHETENEQTHNSIAEKKGKRKKKRKKSNLRYPPITGKETCQSPESLLPTPSLKTLHFLGPLLRPGFIL